MSRLGYPCLEAILAFERARTLLCCAILQVAAFIGVPMQPDQIRELLQALNQPKVAHTAPEERREDQQRRKPVIRPLGRRDGPIDITGREAAGPLRQV